MSFKYLTKVNEFISQNSSVSFDGGAALFGSYRKDEFTTFFWILSHNMNKIFNQEVNQFQVELVCYGA